MAHGLLPHDQRTRANARAYANVYERRGRLPKGPCVKCRNPRAEKHHDDYGKPLSVLRMCTSCHLSHHGKTCHVAH